MPLLFVGLAVKKKKKKTFDIKIVGSSVTSTYVFYTKKKNTSPCDMVSYSELNIYLALVSDVTYIKQKSIFH